MNVLLAADGSRHAAYAENFLSQFPGASEMNVTAVSVCVTADLHSMGFDFPIEIHEVVANCRQQSTSVLDALTQRVSKWASSVDTKILDGHPAKELLHEIDQNHPDVCVVGSHGWTLTERFLLGSVSDRVAKHAGCPVMIVRPKGENLEECKLRHILIADDGSDVSDAAIARFSKIKTEEETHIHLISVILDASAIGFIPPPNFEETIEKQRAEILERLERHRDKLHAATPNVDVEVLLSDNIPRSIFNYASENDIDLLVMGGKKRSMVNRLLLGSISLDVLHHAPCSVWIER